MDKQTLLMQAGFIHQVDLPYAADRVATAAIRVIDDLTAKLEQQAAQLVKLRVLVMQHKYDHGRFPADAFMQALKEGEQVGGDSEEETQETKEDDT